MCLSEHENLPKVWHFFGGTSFSYNNNSSTIPNISLKNIQFPRNKSTLMVGGLDDANKNGKWCGEKRRNTMRPELHLFQPTKNLGC